MINVTKTYLPTLEEYTRYLKQIWESHWVTNFGPLATKFEESLKENLEVNYIRYVNNGTIALQIAIKALELEGDIITTPFSYVATTSSISWEGCRPVFVDIDPEQLTIDPNMIESAITEKTTAILATHVYGNPCDVMAIDKIAKKNNLKVIYDAAHSYGVKYRGQSILNYGDISTLSFHATKLLHTIEGGALVCSNKELHRKITHLMNFGHNGPEDFVDVGINGKSSEFHAAMGLCLIPKVATFIARRKEITQSYDKVLLSPKLNLRRPKIRPETEYNYSYYPIIFSSESELLKTKAALLRSEINPRRYFYPSLSKLYYVDKFDVPISEDISSRILCLPLFYELKNDEIEKILEVIVSSL